METKFSYNKQMYIFIYPLSKLFAHGKKYHD